MSRGCLGVRSIRKSAGNVTCPPLLHLHTFTPFSIAHWPPPEISMLIARESVTSLAVQVRFWLLPCAFQTSWIQVLGAASDGWAPKSTAPVTKRETAMTSWTNLVRHMPAFITMPPLLGSSHAAGAFGRASDRPQLGSRRNSGRPSWGSQLEAGFV